MVPNRRIDRRARAQKPGKPKPPGNPPDLPDPDEPRVHLYAEGNTEQASEELQSEIQQIVTDVIEREEVVAQP